MSKETRQFTDQTISCWNYVLSTELLRITEESTFLQLSQGECHSCFHPALSLAESSKNAVIYKRIKFR